MVVLDGCGRWREGIEMVVDLGSGADIITLMRLQDDVERLLVVDMILSSPADKPYGSAEYQSRYQGQRGPTPSRSALNFHRADVSRRD